MNSKELREQILDVTGCIDVDEIGPGSLRVHMPNLRFSHDTVTMSVSHDGNTWSINDLGQLGYDVPTHVDEVVEALNNAGARYELGDDGSVSCVIEDETALADAVTSFAYYLSAAPTVWHTLESAHTSEPRAQSAAALVAEETRTALINQFGQNRASFFKTRHQIIARSEKINAPLVVTQPKQQPWLAASCIDTSASPNAVQAAKASASFMFQVLAPEPYPLFLIVRGGKEQAHHLSDLYDPQNVTVVESSDLSTLIASTQEVLADHGIAA